ncbi:MAG: IS66 family insertion sequence element accessory protein TnpA [Planctomycetaceae bacterium]|jgi:hypothetical protein
MAGRRREQLRAEWIDRLRRFQKRSGNVEEFCRAEGVSLAMLYRWRQRLAETVAGRVAGPRAKVPARVTRKVAPFAAVRIRPVPDNKRCQEPLLRKHGATLCLRTQVKCHKQSR